MKPVPCYCGRTKPMYWEVRTPTGREVFDTKRQAEAYIKRQQED